jgi:hypothetical protein
LDIYKGELETAARDAREAEALAETLAAHRQAPFLWRSLSEVYRKVGDLAKSEQMARRLITDALVTGYYQSVGIGLLELSETLQATKRLLAAAESVAVARAIPRSVSSVLHDAAKVRYRSFVSQYGMSLMSAVDNELEEKHWTAIAARIGEGKTLFAQNGV